MKMASITVFFSSLTLVLAHAATVDKVEPKISAHQFTIKQPSTIPNTAMYPTPQKNVSQHIIELSPVANEEDFQIQVQFGKTQMLDCNKHGLLGQITEHSIPNWGYTYYRLDSISPSPSTMKACFDKAKKQVFIHLPQELMLPYNSTLPKVFYLPKDVQLRYRIWEAQTPFQYSPTQK